PAVPVQRITPRIAALIGDPRKPYMGVETGRPAGVRTTANRTRGFLRPGHLPRDPASCSRGPRRGPCPVRLPEPPLGVTPMPAAQDREGTLSAEEVRVLGLPWSAALVERSRRSGIGLDHTFNQWIGCTTAASRPPSPPRRATCWPGPRPACHTG